MDVTGISSNGRAHALYAEGTGIDTRILQTVDFSSKRQNSTNFLEHFKNSI